MVVAVGLLAQLEPLQVPWAYALMATGLVAIAATTQLWENRHAPRAWWTRWDLPSFGVGHAVALFAIVAAVPADQIPLTWIGLGALSALIGTRLRHVAWFATKNLTIVGAYVNAGDEDSASKVGLGDGVVLSAQYAF